MGAMNAIRHKGLQLLAGQPLLRHVMARLDPQCEQLMLSVETTDPCWEPFGLQQVADLLAGGQGPLGGLLAAMQALPGTPGWLLLAPCDAPFLPLNLAEQLARCASEKQAAAALVNYQGEWQPTFSLWHTRLLPELRAAVMEQGRHGLKEFLRTRDCAVLDWPATTPNPFFNINEPADLALAADLAADLLDQPTVPIS